MAPPSLVANDDISTVKAHVSGRIAKVYSEVQNSRLDHSLPLPSVIRNPFNVVDGPASSAAGNPDEIAKLFLFLFGQPSAVLVPDDGKDLVSGQNLKIGVVLSGGQAPGGHNVISGIFDCSQDRYKRSTLYGFKGGPTEIMKGKYVTLTPEYVYLYRNRMEKRAQQTFSEFQWQFCKFWEKCSAGGAGIVLGAALAALGIRFSWSVSQFSGFFWSPTWLGMLRTLKGA